jgi:hypothetical protein
VERIGRRGFPVNRNEKLEALESAFIQHFVEDRLPERLHEGASGRFSFWAGMFSFFPGRRALSDRVEAMSFQVLDDFSEVLARSGNEGLFLSSDAPDDEVAMLLLLMTFHCFPRTVLASSGIFFCNHEADVGQLSPGIFFTAASWLLKHGTYPYFSHCVPSAVLRHEQYCKPPTDRELEVQLYSGLLEAFEDMEEPHGVNGSKMLAFEWAKHCLGKREAS